MWNLLVGLGLEGLRESIKAIKMGCLCSKSELCNPPRVLKVMMFGPGNAGKTTVIKAIRKGFGVDVTKEEDNDPKKIKGAMKKNIVESTIILIEQAKVLFPDDYAKAVDLHVLEQATMKWKKDIITATITSSDAKAIETFWCSPLGENVWNARDSFDTPIHDNTKKFLPKVSAIVRSDYVPNLMDILLVRQETINRDIRPASLPSTQEESCCCFTVDQRRILEIQDCGGQVRHQRAYRSDDDFIKFSRESDLLFCVVPIGDLAEERINECITYGLRIINDILKTVPDLDLIVSASTKQGVVPVQVNSLELKNGVDFRKKPILIFLNKLDKLEERVNKSSKEKILEDWLIAAKQNAKKYGESSGDDVRWLDELLEFAQKLLEKPSLDKFDACGFFKAIIDQIFELHRQDKGFTTEVVRITKCCGVKEEEPSRIDRHHMGTFSRYATTSVDVDNLESLKLTFLNAAFDQTTKGLQDMGFTDGEGEVNPMAMAPVQVTRPAASGRRGSEFSAAEVYASYDA